MQEKPLLFNIIRHEKNQDDGSWCLLFEWKLFGGVAVRKDGDERYPMKRAAVHYIEGTFRDFITLNLERLLFFYRINIHPKDQPLPDSYNRLFKGVEYLLANKMRPEQMADIVVKATEIIRSLEKTGTENEGFTENILEVCDLIKNFNSDAPRGF